MKSNVFWFWLILALVIFLIFRFAGFVFVMAFKFWYIAIPVILYLVWRKKSVKEEDVADDGVVDADFQVLDEEDDK